MKSDSRYRYGASDKLFFTSDTHFCHMKILEYANRPFATVQEMNEALIRNWNEAVPEDGIVYHLGDFCFGGADEWLSIIPRLNGNIHLIMGNHDLRNAGESFMSCFESVSQQRTISVNGQTIVLNHNPFLCFGGAYRGVWQLFGHVHSGPRSLGNGRDDVRLVHLFPTQYDVGVDNNDYRPVSYERVRDIIRTQVAHEKRS